MICVCGIGYVGLVTALCLSKHGHKVVCFDKDNEKINLLSAGEPVIYEAGIKELLNQAIESSTIKFTNNKEMAIIESSTIFICVGTPTVNGEADLSNISELIDDISEYSESDKMIIIKSTVPVGTCKYFQSLIQNKVKNKIKLTIVSNPEFLREGNAINDFLYPERVVIGSEDFSASKEVEKLYKKIIHKNVPVIITDTYTSELIKYASNAFLCVKISFINEIAKLSASIGANIADIEYAVGLDRRIGHEHLVSGLGFGGSCLPKDLSAFINIGTHNGIDMLLCQAAEKINNDQINIASCLLEEELQIIKNKRIALWGVTFKKNTNDIRHSPALNFVGQIKKWGAEICIFDPIGMTDFSLYFPEDEKIKYFSDKYEALEKADALVVMTDWDEFSEIDLLKITAAMRTRVIIDCKKLYWQKRNLLTKKGFQYRCIGLQKINYK